MERDMVMVFGWLGDAGLARNGRHGMRRADRDGKGD